MPFINIIRLKVIQMLNSADYRKMLKCLHLEGYAQSYEDAEYILETISDEEFDALYETIILNPKIVSHLISEGYAYTSEQAEEMLYHMSDNWKQNILESNIKDLGARLDALQKQSATTDAETQKLVQKGRKQFRQLDAAVNRFQNLVDKDIARNPHAENPQENVDLYHLLQGYLISEGYADTYEAADQIISFMSEDWVNHILTEAARDQSNKQIERGIKTTYQAGNVLDNLHQGRSRGISRLPATERAAKVERMRDRLRNRRDDLFGERNRREDETRAQLKKLLGL